MMQTVFENPPGAVYDQMPQMAPEDALFVYAYNHYLGAGGETLVDNETQQPIHLEIGQVAMWRRGGEGTPVNEVYRTADGPLSTLTRDADGNWPSEVVSRLETIRDRLKAQQPTVSTDFDVDGVVLSDSFEQQPQQREGLVAKAGRFLKNLMFKKNPTTSYAGKRRAPENRHDQTRPWQNGQRSSAPRHRASGGHKPKHRK